MDINNLKEAMQLQSRAQSILNSGLMSHYVEDLVAAYELLLTKFAPFKVGDKVRLKRNLTEGWAPVWHPILVEGVPGVVKKVECGRKGFRILVKLDFQKGLFKKSPMGSSFTLREEDLELTPVALDSTGKQIERGDQVLWTPFEEHAQSADAERGSREGVVEHIDNNRRILVRFGDLPGIRSAIDAKTLRVIHATPSPSEG